MPRVKNRHNSPLYDIPPIRTGGRVKKAKIVFDPSENNMPKKRAGRTQSMGAALSSFSDKSGDTPPKIKKIKTSNMEHTVIDSQKKSDTSGDLNKLPPILEPQISDSCMVCGKVESKKGRKLIPCKDCNYKVHASCLKINFQNQNLLEEHWRCNNCTTCVVCYETSEAGTLVTCCVCVEAYHLLCHTPKLNKGLNKLKWECCKCQNINKSVAIAKLPMNVSQENGEKKNAELTSKKQDVIELHLSPNTGSDTANTANGDDTVPDMDDKKNKEQKKEKDTEAKPMAKTKKLIDEEIPDISDWGCEKVCKYIEKYFPREAHIFRDHEIDGASLLLMKRSDVIRGLPLKLGPALRLYSFIVRLQSKSNDPRLTWM